ncbi:hypothetical protein [Chryseobacterium taiwanense]|uniref:Uncharacterized protein n=1 Tax=Chryseobacterium taiwanense TaxID=363331 RepID=A0A0B4D350_9FLAO|nr:hypothetical protein [Chryseobacterium taiwanense]KIC63072.1 hypothetical protein RM51_10540 [Chryseobacterium taiwanense]
MPIIRRSEQKRQTLEDFYKEFIPKAENVYQDVGTPMLEVLRVLNEMFYETKIYGLTSHASLLLFNNDEEDSDYFIVINACQSNYYNEFRIEYIIPENERPWEGAIIQGVSGTFKEFEKMIIISIYNSGGWKNNFEIENLYQKIK